MRRPRSSPARHRAERQEPSAASHPATASAARGTGNAFVVPRSTNGASRSTDPFTDATALWVALHGLAQLRSAATSFPWPPGVLDVLVDRLARLR